MGELLQPHKVDVPKVEAHNVPEVEASSRSQKSQKSNDCRVCNIEKFTLRFIQSHVLKEALVR
jgi:hypothetical protein